MADDGVGTDHLSRRKADAAGIGDVVTDEERVGGGVAWEAFEELLTLHRLKVSALPRKTLLSTNPIESMFSLVWHSERNIARTRGSRMLQRWLGTVCSLVKADSRG